MMKPMPAASFVVTQTEFLLQFLIVPLDDPAMFGQVHQFDQRDIGRQREQPVFGGFFFTGPAIRSVTILRDAVPRASSLDGQHTFLISGEAAHYSWRFYNGWRE